MNLFYFFYVLRKRCARWRNLFYKFFAKKYLKNYPLIDIKFQIQKIIGDFSYFDNDLFDEKSITKVIHKADQIIDNKYDILGFKNIKIDELNWHKDFISNYEWPKGKFYYDYCIVNYSNNSDIKVCWDFNRCHHLLYLGEAYLMTNNEKYVKKFLFDINNWINSNPLMYSVNWTCAMEVSVRVINWIYAFNMIKKSRLVDIDFLHKFNRSLYEHGWYIYRNLENDFDNRSDNHYNSNLAGLLILGLIFNDSKEGQTWKNLAVKESKRIIKFQIYPSGVNFEKSINYGRLVNEFFTFSYILMKNHNIYFNNAFENQIKSQYDFLISYLKNNMYAPVIGDQDNGRLLPFSISQNIDHSYLLTIGAILFNRSDLKSISQGYNLDSFFLLGISSFEKFNKIPRIKIENNSKSFDDAGFFIMRSNDYYLFINNSGLGKFGQGNDSIGSHTHADMLSFELNILGHDILTDSGTYEYTRCIKERYYFSSTNVHNTLTIDNFNQFEINENVYSKFKSLASTKHVLWDSNLIRDIYVGEHDAYQRLDSPVTHRRSFEFLKNEIKLIIVDDIITSGNHIVNSYLNFASGLIPEIINGSFIRVVLNDFIVNIKFKSYNNDLRFSIIDEWCSVEYGVRFKRKKIKINFATNQSAKLKMIFTIDKIK
tara:strand:- start:16034 stop:17995 length:1962 start_codon:yes stop_codon:yes gene_type:complete